MLEMTVDYNLVYCFRNGAPKEAESGKWSLSLDQYPWERDRVIALFLWSASLYRSVPRPLMLMLEAGTHTSMPCRLCTSWPRSWDRLLIDCEQEETL